MCNGSPSRWWACTELSLDSAIHLSCKEHFYHLSARCFHKSTFYFLNSQCSYQPCFQQQQAAVFGEKSSDEPTCSAPNSRRKLLESSWWIQWSDKKLKRPKQSYKESKSWTNIYRRPRTQGQVNAAAVGCGISNCLLTCQSQQRDYGIMC